MIYSRNNIFHDIKFSNGDYLQNCKFNDDDIFYHNHKNNIKIYDCLDQIHWDHLRNNSNVKLLHTNTTETFGQGFSLAIAKTIQTHKIDPKQIYVILYDTVHKTFLENELAKLNVSGVNIGVFDSLFVRTIIPTTLPKSIKKFSALSRNHKIWRLRLYSELVQNDLIDDFVYSYYNINPYANTFFDLDQITKELQQHTNVNQKMLYWIKEIPYKLEDDIIDNVGSIWNNVTFNSILSSDFHLIVETLFEYKPSVSFLTEKTYKALACSKPFLMYSTMGCLTDIRELGYKTFSPHIDETYDTISDNEQRLLAVVNEIKRIKNLNNNDYITLLSNCNLIAAENLKFFQQKKAENINEDNFNSEFDFLKPYTQKYEGWEFPIVIR
jgi:hypothetical protein